MAACYAFAGDGSVYWPLLVGARASRARTAHATFLAGAGSRARWHARTPRDPSSRRRWTGDRARPRYCNATSPRSRS